MHVTCVSGKNAGTLGSLRLKIPVRGDRISGGLWSACICVWVARCLQLELSKNASKASCLNTWEGSFRLSPHRLCNRALTPSVTLYPSWWVVNVLTELTLCTRDNEIAQPFYPRYGVGYELKSIAFPNMWTLRVGFLEVPLLKSFWGGNFQWKGYYHWQPLPGVRVIFTDTVIFMGVMSYAGTEHQTFTKREFAVSRFWREHNSRW